MAKVQIMSSWTRTSPGAVGTMGAGCAFITGGGGMKDGVPLPSGVTSHTHALLFAAAGVLSRFPPTEDLEIEITHRMLVSIFGHFGTGKDQVAAAVDFVRRVLSGRREVVTDQVLDAFASRMLARRARTVFSIRR